MTTPTMKKRLAQLEGEAVPSGAMTIEEKATARLVNGVPQGWTATLLGGGQPIAAASARICV